MRKSTDQKKLRIWTLFTQCNKNIFRTLSNIYDEAFKAWRKVLKVLNYFHEKAPCRSLVGLQIHLCFIFRDNPRVEKTWSRQKINLFLTYDGSVFTSANFCSYFQLFFSFTNLFFTSNYFFSFTNYFFNLNFFLLPTFFSLPQTFILLPTFILHPQMFFYFQLFFTFTNFFFLLPTFFTSTIFFCTFNFFFHFHKLFFYFQLLFYFHKPFYLLPTIFFTFSNFSFYFQLCFYLCVLFFSQPFLTSSKFFLYFNLWDLLVRFLPKIYHTSTFFTPAHLSFCGDLL